MVCVHGVCREPWGDKLIFFSRVLAHCMIMEVVISADFVLKCVSCRVVCPDAPLSVLLASLFSELVSFFVSVSVAWSGMVL